MIGQLRRQAEFLIGFQVMAVAPHQRDQSAVFGAGRIDLSPAGQEVLVDEADHMKAIGHDHRLGEMRFDDGAVDHRQIHADHPDLLFAFQGKKIRLQGGLGAAQGDVVDAVVLQIAEGGGVALLAGEEMLVNAQDLWAKRRMIMAGATLQALQKVPLHRGRAMPLRRPRQLRLMLSRCC